MNFQAIIAARRDGRVHTDQELRFLAQGAADGSIPDYQLAAWLMAAYLNPLNSDETAALTIAMADSGARIDLTGLPKPWVDKHSTGGVGDKTSLVLLPLLAACGLTVIKMSGKGLGITGGTVDKLASIQGMRLDLSPEEMKAQALRIGLALTGQSPNLAPADKTLYALRDVTETVSSIPLIVSSILSKKLAGGAETIVLDVKCGSGAFMKDRSSAETLAQALAETSRKIGLNSRIVLTDMSQPLGAAIGNALEVREAVDVLKPNGVRSGTPSDRFRTLCKRLAAITLHASGICSSEATATEKVEQALESGQALHKASEWISAQGGAFPHDGSRLPQAPHVLTVTASTAGYVSRLDAEHFGRAVVALGGGRLRKDSVIDPAVGIVLHKQVGDAVAKGEALFDIHASGIQEAEGARSTTLEGVTIEDTSVAPPELVLAVY